LEYKTYKTLTNHTKTHKNNIQKNKIKIRIGHLQHACHTTSKIVNVPSLQ